MEISLASMIAYYVVVYLFLDATGWVDETCLAPEVTITGEQLNQPSISLSNIGIESKSMHAATYIIDTGPLEMPFLHAHVFDSEKETA